MSNNDMENKMTQLTVSEDRLQTKSEILEAGIKVIYQLMLGTTGVYKNSTNLLMDPIEEPWIRFFPGGRYEDELKAFFDAVE